VIETVFQCFWVRGFGRSCVFCGLLVGLGFALWRQRFLTLVEEVKLCIVVGQMMVCMDFETGSS